MLRTLVIPDIHLHHETAEKIISFVKPDKIVFLGDYWDDFDDTPQMVCDTAEWFKWSINQSNRIHIAGNHDIMYWFPDNSNIRCGGYEQYKAIAINDIVKPKDWNKLKFFHVLDDWFLTHGGIHPYWIDPVKFRKNEPVTITKEELVKKLKHDSLECKKQLTAGKWHWFIVAGFSRSNSPYVGGVTWCDFNQEFHPMRGIHQIVGHTPDRDKVKWIVMKENDNAIYAPKGAEPELSDKTSFNVCLDSYPALKWYGIWEGKKLTINETKNIVK
jgi:hypothetical protein